MIQHLTVEIPSSELDRSLAFYGILGFEQVEPPAGVEGRALWLERNQSQVHLMPIPDSEHRQPAPSSGHVGIVVDRYEDTLALLREGGYSVDPRREHWGSPRAYVNDPAGNLVELMAWPPTRRPGPRE